MTKKYFGFGDDITDARAVRNSVFIEEQGFDADGEFDEQDGESYHVVLYNEAGAPVATGRWFPTPEGLVGQYTLGRIAVSRSLRKTGAGRMLMLAMEEKAKELGAELLHLGAQRQAQGFYEKCGYLVCGDEYMDEHVPHIPMEKRLEA